MPAFLPTDVATYTLSIETDAGVYQYGCHLGTDLRVARECAEEIFAHRIPKIGTHIRTVALLRRGEKPRYYDGEWSGAPM